MTLIPLVPKGTVIPYGLSRFAHSYSETGFRLRVPFWARYGSGDDVKNDRKTVGWWVGNLVVKIAREPIGLKGFCLTVSCAEVDHGKHRVVYDGAARG